MSYKCERKTEMREVVVSTDERIVCDACAAPLPFGNSGAVSIPGGWATFRVSGRSDDLHFCPLCAERLRATLVEVGVPYYVGFPSVPEPKENA